MKLVALTLALLLTAGSAQANITFRPGWDSQENNDVPNPKTKRPYTKSEATEYLKKASDQLKELIEASQQTCMLEVTKGCHQKGSPHFTVNGLKSTATCNKTTNLYVGSKSDHDQGGCDK